MWTHARALHVIKVYVETMSDGRDIVVESLTIDKPYGWVFFYQSRAFLESGDRMQMLLGNAPLIFDRINGEIRVTGTAYPIEHYIAEYEATLPPARLQGNPEPRRAGS